MKKLFAMFIALTVMFSSVGTTILFLDEPTAEAKSYKSGKKGFNSNKNTNIQNSNTNTNNKTDATTNKNNNTTNTNKAEQPSKGGFFSGGLMKGLMLGGLAGLLFGSLFGDMGMLGSILGFMINAFAIAAVVILCIKLVQFFTRKKEKEEDKRQWNN